MALSARSGTGDAAYLHLRLFMEGIEVPVIGASVNVGLNVPASAQIQVVPSDALSTILPRTVVHLFYLDSKEFTDSGAREPDDHHYKLLFCGEIFDINFGRSGQGSRTVTFRCLDFSNTWDTNYSYIMRYAVGAQSDPSGGVLHDLSGFTGGGGSNDSVTNANPFDDIVSEPSQVIRQMALSAGPANPALPGAGTVLGGLLSILELLCGVQGYFLGVNPWATVEERRCRVLDSVVGDNGETAKSLFSQQTFADWLQQKSGSYGSVISFRQIVNMICEYIYYDVVTNVTPMYLAGNDGDGRPGRLKPNLSITVGAGELDSATKEALAELVEETKGLTGLQGDIGGLDSGWWAYCVEMFKQLDTLCEGQTFPYPTGEENKPIQFVLSSGFRNAASQNRIRAKRGQDPMTEEEEQINAHLQGFAIDVCPVGCGGSVGLMPYKVARGKSEGTEVGAGESNSNMVVRFRKALWMFYDLGTPMASFESLVAGIENNDKILGACFTDTEPADDGTYTFDKDTAVTLLKQEAAKVQNWAHFFSLYEKAIDATNVIAPGGIKASWGGRWVQSPDPLWGLFGLGNDPIHIQKVGFVAGTASTMAAAPVVTEVPTPGKEVIRERLKSYIFRPNIWFSPPPVCNVILPSMYESLSVSRQMMRETTRLQLSSYNQFYESVLLNNYFYAPQFPDGNHIIGEGLGSVTKTIIMDHEVYSGIIPKMEKISELSFYARQSGETADVRIETAEVSVAARQDAASSEAGSAIANYGQRVAHFNLLTHRYSSRTAGMQGPFNPMLVCGFPAVIVNELPQFGTSEDSGFRSPELLKIIDGERVDVVQRKITWLGMITSLTHTYDQSGARTNAQLSYVRSHRVGDDSDDLLSESVTDQGSFAIQDPNFVPATQSTGDTHIFAAPINIQVAEAQSEENSKDWVFAILEKLVGVSSLPDILEKAPPVKVPVPLGSFNPYEAEGITSVEAYQNFGQLISPDYSGSAKEQDVSGITFQGAELNSATWEGAAYWVCIRFVATELAYSPAELRNGPPRGRLKEIVLMSPEAAIPDIGADVVQAVKDSPSLVAFGHYDDPGAGIPVDTSLPVSHPTGYTNFDVLIKLPGSSIKVSVKGAQSRGGRDAKIPVEEAIRPPWIDKNSYSAEESSTASFSKICQLYRQFFGCPSILHLLFQSGATPYDDMSLYSVEQAVDFIMAHVASLSPNLSGSYSYGFGSRPIASLMDVLAPKGYLPSRVGLGKYVWSHPPNPSRDVSWETLPTTPEAIQVSGGFHSNAVTGYKFSPEPGKSETGTIATLKFGRQLEFLDLDQKLANRLQPSKTVTIDAGTGSRLDPRAARAYRISQYVEDIDGKSSIRQSAIGSRFIKTPRGKGKSG